MKQKILVLGDERDKEAMSTARLSLGEGQYEVEIGDFHDEKTMERAMTADIELLWLSSSTPAGLYTMAKNLASMGKLCVNFFSEPVCLTKEQKYAVGENYTIFAALDPINCMEDLNSLLRDFLHQTPNVTDTHKSIIINDPTPPAYSISKDGWSISVQSEDINDSVVPRSNATASPEETMIKRVHCNDAGSENGHVQKTQLTEEDNISISLNDTQKSESDIELETTPKELAPGKSILEMIGTLIGAIVVARMLSLDERSIGWYIVFFVPIIINFILLLRVNNWRKTHGFNFMMLLAFIVWILISLICLSVMWYSLVMAFS